MRVTDTDVIIVGAGPTGLMLAAELCLAGVRPLLLERQPRPRETPKASGFNGQIVELLRYRGLLDRIEAASARPVGAARGAPFGGTELDFSHLTDPRYGQCISPSRGSSACSASTPTNSAPASTADTRWSASARTTPPWRRLCAARTGPTR
jgi:choline dehydrogenase-like flavoprotein